MAKTVNVIGSAGLKVGKYQTPNSDGVRVLEHEVMAQLVIDAMADAGVEKGDIGALIFSNPRPYTEQKYFATFMAHYLGLPCEGMVMEVLGNGMTGGIAFDQAANEILLGRAKVALALGVNFESAVSSAEHANSSMRHTGDIDFHTPFGFTPISWYAMDAVRYMHDYGVSREELASVSVKNRFHASLNPLAQYRTLITLEEVMSQRPIVEPFGLYEVPPRGDGAVCLVLASEDVAEGLKKPHARMRGRGFYHEGAHQISEVPNDMTAFTSVRVASQKAYSEAGIKAADLDFAEVYAPCTIVEVLVSEALGLVPRGEGAKASCAGETTLGGRIPICTSGGHLSRGHPALVTPLYILHEMSEQLRGRAGKRQVEGAELGVTTCELGNYNAALIHVFEARQ